MGSARLKLAAGTALLAIGAAILAGASVYRNAAVQRFVGILDFSDRICRKSSVAKGAACPAGCVARPPRAPSDRYAAPECRSRLWVATCGKSCEPEAGFVRLPDGGLAFADRLEVQLSDGVDAAAFMRRVRELGAEADSALSGLHRYRVSFPNPDGRHATLERLKRALERTDGVARVAYDLE